MDLISRQAAIDIISHHTFYDDYDDTDKCSLIDGLRQLPSTQPERKKEKGEWLDDCTCSICCWIHEDNNGFALITKYNFCPNCGAKMEVTE